MCRPGLYMSALKTCYKRSFLTWVKLGEKARLADKNICGHQCVLSMGGDGAYIVYYMRGLDHSRDTGDIDITLWGCLMH